MRSLYEITERYRQVLKLVDDSEFDEQTLTDTLEGVGGELQEKKRSS